MARVEPLHHPTDHSQPESSWPYPTSQIVDALAAGSASVNPPRLSFELSATCGRNVDGETTENSLSFRRPPNESRFLLQTHGSPILRSRTACR